MKLGFISQRMDAVEGYGEIRDAIDIQWHRLFQQMKAVLLPIPNVPENIDSILRYFIPDFIVLSGGNTPVAYGGNAPERDAVDEKLIEYALQKKIPLLGVCRGMQSVALYFGSTLKEVKGHVAVEHSVCGDINRIVNSYHGFAIDSLGDNLKVLSKTEVDGEIEAVCHRDLAIYGIMWHPERVKGFNIEDMEMIKEWLKL